MKFGRLRLGSESNTKNTETTKSQWCLASSYCNWRHVLSWHFRMQLISKPNFMFSATLNLRKNVLEAMVISSWVDKQANKSVVCKSIFDRCYERKTSNKNKKTVTSFISSDWLARLSKLMKPFRWEMLHFTVAGVSEHMIVMGNWLGTRFMSKTVPMLSRLEFIHCWISLIAATQCQITHSSMKMFIGLLELITLLCLCSAIYH